MMIRPIRMSDASVLQTTEGSPADPRWPTQEDWLRDNIHPRMFVGEITNRWNPVAWGDLIDKTDHEVIRWKVLRPEDRNLGYGTEFVRLLLKEAKTKAVVAYIRPDNIPSSKLAQKMGFRPVLDIMNERSEVQWVRKQ